MRKRAPEASVGVLEASLGSGSPDLMPCLLRREYIAQSICIRLNGCRHLRPISPEVSACGSEPMIYLPFSPTTADPSMSRLQRKSGGFRDGGREKAR